jgi:tetratricopeptide (TPR) repeat protein
MVFVPTDEGVTCEPETSLRLRAWAQPAGERSVSGTLTSEARGLTEAEGSDGLGPGVERLRRRNVTPGLELLGAMGIAICVVAAYWPTLHGGYIWDDPQHVSENMALRSLDGLRRLWIQRGVIPQYYPLTHTTFWIEYHLWGLAPEGYHAVNLLLHAANALLVWRLLDRLRVPGAFLAAAIFAVHPIQVESVAWITERKNLLSGFFYLLAGGAYLRVMQLEDPAPSRPPPSWLDIAALILFACALLAKSVTVTLPCAIALLIFWKRGRIERRELAVLGGALALGFLFALQTAQMEKSYVGAVGPDWKLSNAEHVLVAGRALWFYLGKLVWPTDLLFVYPRWTPDPSQWWQWAFPVAALLVGTLLFAFRRVTGSGPLVAALYYAGTLVPALGFFNVYPMRFSFVANHFAYLATIGPIALAASAGALVAARLPRVPRNTLQVGAALVLLTLIVLSNRDARHYRIPELWTSTLERNPACWLCEANLGWHLLTEGQIDEAIQHIERALALKPDFTVARANLGTALLYQGRPEEAIPHFEAVLAQPPDQPNALVNAQVGLGEALVMRGEGERGIAHLEEAVRLAPASPYARFSLGSVLLRQGRPEEAVIQLEQVLRLRPDSSQARDALAEARAQAAQRSRK